MSSKQRYIEFQRWGVDNAICLHSEQIALTSRGALWALGSSKVGSPAGRHSRKNLDKISAGICCIGESRMFCGSRHISRFDEHASKLQSATRTGSCKFSFLVQNILQRSSHLVSGVQLGNCQVGYEMSGVRG